MFPQPLNSGGYFADDDLIAEYFVNSETGEDTTLLKSFYNDVLRDKNDSANPYLYQSARARG